jgi:hypothetical protein
MAELTDHQIDAALARGQSLRANEARALSARYDEKARRVIVELTNGATFAFPPELAEGLAGASDEDLSQIEILGGGYGLHWEALDVDFTVPGLLSGVFGTRSYLARRAGQAKSPAKSAAARINGARGGRPRKTAGE